MSLRRSAKRPSFILAQKKLVYVTTVIKRVWPVLQRSEFRYSFFRYNSLIYVRQDEMMFLKINRVAPS